MWKRNLGKAMCSPNAMLSRMDGISAAAGDYPWTAPLTTSRPALTKNAPLADHAYLFEKLSVTGRSEAIMIATWRGPFDTPSLPLRRSVCPAS